VLQTHRRDARLSPHEAAALCAAIAPDAMTQPALLPELRRIDTKCGCSGLSVAPLRFRRASTHASHRHPRFDAGVGCHPERRQVFRASGSSAHFSFHDGYELADTCHSLDRDVA
jgi:hypothetical protein